MLSEQKRDIKNLCAETEFEIDNKMSDEIDRNDEIAMFMEISGKFSTTEDVVSPPKSLAALTE